MLQTIDIYDTVYATDLTFDDRKGTSARKSIYFLNIYKENGEKIIVQFTDIIFAHLIVSTTQSSIFTV